MAAEKDKAPTPPPAPAPKPKRYQVNWQLDSFKGEVLEAGATLQATDEEAAPLLGVGVLTLLEA